MGGGGGCLVKLWTIPSHIPTQIQLNESPTHTPTIFVHVSFLFPTQAVFFLSRQHLHHLSLSNTEQRQCYDCKNMTCFSSVSPHSWSRDLDVMSHTVCWGTGHTRQLINLPCVLDEFQKLAILTGDPLAECAG